MVLKVLKFAKIYRLAGEFELDESDKFIQDPNSLEYNSFQSPSEPNPFSMEQVHKSLEDFSVVPNEESSSEEDEDDEFPEPPAEASSEMFPKGTLVNIVCKNGEYPAISLGEETINGKLKVKFVYESNGQEGVSPIKRVNLREKPKPNPKSKPKAPESPKNKFPLRLTLRACRSALINGFDGTVSVNRKGSKKIEKEIEKAKEKARKETGEETGGTIEEIEYEAPQIPIKEVLSAAGSPFTETACQKFIDANTGVVGPRFKSIFKQEGGSGKSNKSVKKAPTEDFDIGFGKEPPKPKRTFVDVDSKKIDPQNMSQKEFQEKVLEAESIARKRGLKPSKSGTRGKFEKEVDSLLVRSKFPTVEEYKKIQASKKAKKEEDK